MPGMAEGRTGLNQGRIVEAVVFGECCPPSGVDPHDEFIIMRGLFITSSLAKCAHGSKCLRDDSKLRFPVAATYKVAPTTYKVAPTWYFTSRLPPRPARASHLTCDITDQGR